MGVKIGGDAAKNDKNNHLLLVMCVRLLQKIGLLNLRNLPITSAQILM